MRVDWWLMPHICKALAQVAIACRCPLRGLFGACTCLGCYLLVATEDFLNWMYCIHMACVGEVLGLHVHMLRRYGVSPDEAVEAAVAKLQPTAPHIARLLLELASLH